MSLRFLIALVLVAACSAFAPAGLRPRLASVRMSAEVETPGSVNSAPLSPTRQAFAGYMTKARPLVAAFGALMMAPALTLAAAEAGAPVAEEKVVLGPPPSDFGLKYKDFYEDCSKVISHMRYAVQMEKGDSNIAAVAEATKDEMLDFVSYYRRFNGISGKQSFSLLYTSINVLAGHYTSYGIKYPVPEKRRKRLLQEFLDIEKNIRKKR